MSEELVTIRAVVRAIDGDDALVEVEQGGCGRCHEKGGCGGQHLTQTFCSGPRTWRARNDIQATVGDSVRVAVTPESLRRSANLAYGLPLLALVGGAVAGMAIAGEIASIGGAVVAVGSAFFWLRRHSSQGAGNQASQPHIISRH